MASVYTTKVEVNKDSSHKKFEKNKYGTARNCRHFNENYSKLFDLFQKLFSLANDISIINGTYFVYYFMKNMLTNYCPRKKIYL